MRIHSDKLTEANIRDAARAAGAHFAKLDERGSRSRARAFDVLLRGASNRRPNGGPDSRDDFAATWDQWGIFLGQLFAIDSEMVTPYYAHVDDFNHKTRGRFINGTTPADMHGDHVFRPTGQIGVQGCTKCSAEVTHL